MYGAVVTVKLDIGGPPIILGRDILDSTALSTPASTAMTDLTAPVLSINASWGSHDPRGILTDVEAGSCTISFLDVARDMDPGNVDAVGVMTPGANGQVLVDGDPVFTGFMDFVSHDLANGVTTVILQDAVARLSAMTVAVTLSAGGTFDQLDQLMAAVGWTAYHVVGGSENQHRLEDAIVMSAWAALNRLKDAELADLWVDRAGVVQFRPRDGDAPDVGPDVGDSPAIPLMDLVTTNRRVGIVNDIVIDMDDPYPDRHYDAPSSVGRNGRRSVSFDQASLRLI